MSAWLTRLFRSSGEHRHVVDAPDTTANIKARAATMQMTDTQHKIDRAIDVLGQTGDMRSIAEILEEISPSRRLRSRP